MYEEVEHLADIPSNEIRDIHAGALCLKGDLGITQLPLRPLHLAKEEGQLRPDPEN
jgi:hypothetical protein